MAETPLEFPDKGLDVSQPVSAQPPLTTAQGANVRSFDLAQRQRGGSRNGLVRYLDDPLPGLIQELNTVVSINDNNLGNANMEEGDPGWTQIDHAGSYVVGCSPTATGNTFGTWTQSEVFAVDLSGNIATGKTADGFAVGGAAFDDPSILLANTIPLPSG